MEPLKKTAKNITNSKQRAKVLFTIRQTFGQAILAAGSIAFIAQNLHSIKTNFAIGTAASIVALVLYFANKR